VGPQGPVARIVGTDHFWVEAAVPLEALPRIGAPPPGQESGGAPVSVRLAGAATGVSWQGKVLRVLGDLDPVGAQARVLVEIPDPLGLVSGGPALLLNAFVEVTFEGGGDAAVTAGEAVRIPRRALREGDKVWVLAGDETLEIRDVDVVLREADSVLVGVGLKAGERVITSRLAAPLPGMKLRLPAAALPVAPPATTGALPAAGGPQAPVSPEPDAAGASAPVGPASGAGGPAVPAPAAATPAAKVEDETAGDGGPPPPAAPAADGGAR
jgi:hypothetical protein